MFRACAMSRHCRKAGVKWWTHQPLVLRSAPVRLWRSSNISSLEERRPPPLHVLLRCVQADTKLSQYELARKANIEKNNRHLAAMGVTMAKERCSAAMRSTQATRASSAPKRKRMAAASEPADADYNPASSSSSSSSDEEVLDGGKHIGTKLSAADGACAAAAAAAAAQNCAEESFVEAAGAAMEAEIEKQVRVTQCIKLHEGVPAVS